MYDEVLTVPAPGCGGGVGPGSLIANSELRSSALGPQITLGVARGQLTRPIDTSIFLGKVPNIHKNSNLIDFFLSHCVSSKNVLLQRKIFLLLG